MKHPFENIQPKRRRTFFLLFLAGTLLLMWLMNYIGEPLNTDASPFGIISFEFAASLEKSQGMIESWGMDGLVRAAFIQGLDFLFPWVYASAISLGCVMASDVLTGRKWPLAGLGQWMAWGIWLAAGLDYVENIGLSAILLGANESGWAMVAAVCAAVKFGLIFLGMIYALYGLVIRLVVPQVTS